MIAALLNLTVQGTTALAVIFLFDELFSGRMQARWRRWWWVAVPLFFLVPWKVEVLPASTAQVFAQLPGNVQEFLRAEIAPEEMASLRMEAGPMLDGVLVLWALGAAVSFLLLLWNTWRVSRRWTGERFSTDARLLSMLEDCKEQAGVNAPIGIIVSGKIAAPAILGWLRPRILLPASLTDETVLRHVLLHELAHFRSWDIPVGWLYAVARCVHWFNPLVYVAVWLWARFREEAADESAMRPLAQPSQYGETLLSLAATTPAVPYGALGIGESFSHLKARITKIMKHHKRTPKMILAFTILGVLTASLMLRAEEADPKTAAVAAMEIWLKGIDEGKYAESWKEASTDFQKAVTSDQWVAALKAVRGPLGPLQKRELASALHQTEIPTGKEIIKGDFVIAQFETSYANMKYNIETVTFQKEGGAWKASGYFIKPK